MHRKCIETLEEPPATTKGEIQTSFERAWLPQIASGEKNLPQDTSQRWRKSSQLGGIETYQKVESAGRQSWSCELLMWAARPPIRWSRPSAKTRNRNKQTKQDQNQKESLFLRTIVPFHALYCQSLVSHQLAKEKCLQSPAPLPWGGAKRSDLKLKGSKLISSTVFINMEEEN